ncbi:hypothetical protein BH09PSE2_BH09PSE2_00340 [soil metagenome]
MSDLQAILRCPACHGDVADAHCTRPTCTYAAGFPIAAGQPVLVDFDNSIFDRAAYQRDTGSVLKRDDSRRGLKARLDHAAFGVNPIAPRIAGVLLQRLRAKGGRPRVLVIGGGAKGSGAEALYDAEDIDLVGTDVYASAYTRLVADGHNLPFKDGTFDAVWIQAVLEHVLEPQRVVDEIHRVLRSDGLVFADTPFMQQVHEGAYDFTRFTMNGHRWLLRRFSEIEAGPVAGAGTVLSWGVRGLVHALGAPSKVSTALKYLTFPLRFLDGVGPMRNRADGASGVYFFGSKSTESLTPKDMVAYYADQARAAPR